LSLIDFLSFSSTRCQLFPLCPLYLICFPSCSSVKTFAMFFNSQLVCLLISVVFVSNAVARERWLERDGRALNLRIARRRFGQEQPAVLQKIGQACPGQVCGVLAGEAVTPLLAAQGECTQQDHADKIIDAAQQFDAATKANMIQLAIEYRQVEKNTAPDFSTNPPSQRNSVFCQKAPKNPELNGLVQAQDPANDPNLFFDPATKTTVTKGSQANTAPFGGVVAAPVNNTGNTGNGAQDPTGGNNQGSQADCPPNVTVTVAAGGVGPTATAAPVPENNNGGTGQAPANNGNGATGSIGDFGSCSVPEIDFAVGFDNRKETSFQPADLDSFSHGSAQNIDIITRFMCDTLTNKCKADQTAKNTCQKAAAAASAATKGTGGQADAFNKVFGINTNLNAIASVDNQGKVVPGTGAQASTKRSLRRRRGVGSQS